MGDIVKLGFRMPNKTDVEDKSNIQIFENNMGYHKSMKNFKRSGEIIRCGDIVQVQNYYSIPKNSLFQFIGRVLYDHYNSSYNLMLRAWEEGAQKPIRESKAGYYSRSLYYNGSKRGFENTNRNNNNEPTFIDPRENDIIQIPQNKLTKNCLVLRYNENLINPFDHEVKLEVAPIQIF